MLVFLALLLGIAAWWFVVAFQYGKTLKMFAYSRGANVDPGAGKTAGKVDLKCDAEREICVWRATAVCTGTNGVVNHESSPLDAYSTGTTGTTKYGAFNPSTTTDLTAALGGAANGKESYTYNFNGKTALPKCIGSGTNSTVRPQLVATYSCIPKGQKCTGSQVKASS